MSVPLSFANSSSAMATGQSGDVNNAGAWNVSTGSSKLTASAVPDWVLYAGAAVAVLFLIKTLKK